MAIKCAYEWSRTTISPRISRAVFPRLTIRIDHSSYLAKNPGVRIKGVEPFYPLDSRSIKVGEHHPVTNCYMGSFAGSVIVPT